MAEITFDLPYLFHPGTDQDENTYALRLFLETLIRLDCHYLQSRRTLNLPSLYRSGVRYGRTDEWLTIPALYLQKYGDCKSLAAALIAEYRIRGIAANPSFRWVQYPNGNRDYHILVQTANGFEDPSRVLGMGANEVAPFLARG